MSRRKTAKRAEAGEREESRFLQQFSKQTAFVGGNWKTILLVVIGLSIILGLKVLEEASSSPHQRSVPEENLYKVLELPSSATAKEIKKQFNQLVMKYHPDKNPACEDCSARYEKIVKAFETLSNAETRAHYDQSNGVLEPIRSSTVSITPQNYDSFVRHSGRPWILQIYDEESSLCQSFARFWEEFTAEYPFINFGRIHAKRSSRILRRLPFVVIELPLVYSSVVGAENALFEYNADRSPNGPFTSFLRGAFSHGHKTISTDQLKGRITSRRTKPCFVLLSVDSLPIPFLYHSLLFAPYFDFAATSPAALEETRRFLESPKARMIFIPAASNSPVRISEQIPTLSSITAFLSHGKSAVIPQLSRYSFADFCINMSKFQANEQRLPTLCVIALKEADDYDELIRLFEQKRDQNEHDSYENYAGLRENISPSIHRVQFATLSLSSNPAFTKYVMPSLQKRKVRYIVYVSELNLIGGFNNLFDLDVDLEDLRYGEFDKLSPWNEVCKIEADFMSLLRNENFSPVRCLLDHIQSSWFYTLLLLLVCWFSLARLGYRPSLSFSISLAGIFAYLGLRVYLSYRGNSIAY